MVFIAGIKILNQILVLPTKNSVMGSSKHIFILDTPKANYSISEVGNSLSFFIIHKKRYIKNPFHPAVYKFCP